MSRQAERINQHNRRKRNKHGRTGAPKPLPNPSEEPVKPDSYDYKQGYKTGIAHGVAKAESNERVFLEELLRKRNAKDIKGLIEKRLDGRG